MCSVPPLPELSTIVFKKVLHSQLATTVFKKGSPLVFGTVEPDSSWDIIKAVDLWEDGDPDDGYVLVKQEDVVDGITSYMAAYLLSLKKTKVDVSFT